MNCIYHDKIYIYIYIYKDGFQKSLNDLSDMDLFELGKFVLLSVLRQDERGNTGGTGSS